MVRSRWPLPLVLASLLAVLASASLQAAADWPVPRGPSREPQPIRYDPQQWKSVPRPFLDDSAACILYSGISYLIEPDGTIESVSHEITRLAGRKAIEKVGEYRGITYDPTYQKLTLHEARIHKADGRITAVQPQHLQLRDVSTDYQVYDHDKQLIISFPGLEVGDTIEVKWSLRGRNPEHAGQFFTRYSFGDTTYPVVADESASVCPRTGRSVMPPSTAGSSRPGSSRATMSSTCGGRPTVTGPRRATTSLPGTSCGRPSAAPPSPPGERWPSGSSAFGPSAGNAPPT